MASDEVSGKNEMTRSFHDRGHRGHRDEERRARRRHGRKSKVPTGSGSPVAKVSEPPIESRGWSQTEKNLTQRRGARRDYAEMRLVVWGGRDGGG